MLGFRAMKEIKKKLKRRRRPVWTLGMLAVVFAAAAAAGIGGAALFNRSAFETTLAISAEPNRADTSATDKPTARASGSNTARDAALRTLERRKGDVEMLLHRVYLCGEETRKLGRRSAKEAADLLRSRRDWDASFDAKGRIVFEESVDDLSPACRENAYIGLDGDGNLSLFDGPPRKNNVVRTFFQLDVRSLESSLSKERLHELAGGIRVADKDEYNSVVSAFSDFAYRKSAGRANAKK